MVSVSRMQDVYYVGGRRSFTASWPLLESTLNGQVVESCDSGVSSATNQPHTLRNSGKCGRVTSLTGTTLCYGMHVVHVSLFVFWGDYNTLWEAGFKQRVFIDRLNSFQNAFHHQHNSFLLTIYIIYPLYIC